MLKVRVWDLERMYDPEYEGPMEYKVRQMFTTRDGHVEFCDLHGVRYDMDPNEFMFDIFSEDTSHDRL